MVCHWSLSLAAWACLGGDSQTGVSCWLQQALGASSLSHVNGHSLCAGSIWHNSPPAPQSILPAPSPVWSGGNSPLLLRSLHFVPSSVHFGYFAAVSVAEGGERVKSFGQRVCDRGITKSPGSSNSAAADRGFGGCGAADGTALLQPQD